MGIVFHPMTLGVVLLQKNKTLAATIQIKKTYSNPLQKSTTPNQQLQPFARIIYILSNSFQKGLITKLLKTPSPFRRGVSRAIFLPVRPGAPWNTSITSPTSILLNWSLSSISRLSESTISLTTSVSDFECPSCGGKRDRKSRKMLCGWVNLPPPRN